MATTAGKAGYPVEYVYNLWKCQCIIGSLGSSCIQTHPKLHWHFETNGYLFFLQTAFTEESCLHWEGFPIQIVIDVKLVITVMLYTFEKFLVGGACASIKHFLSASLLVSNVWAWSVAPITVHRWLRIYIRHLYKYWL